MVSKPAEKENEFVAEETVEKPVKDLGIPPEVEVFATVVIEDSYKNKLEKAYSCTRADS